MKDGFWINIATGRHERITEHCDWIKVRQNAEKIGLPKSVYEQIKDIPNDYSGARREKILRAVMGAGFIRVRGHGAWIAIEFTAPTKDAVIACRRLLQQVNTTRGGSRLIVNPHVLCCFLRPSLTEAPSLHRSYPVSQVVRTSPPPYVARPDSREVPVGYDCNRH
jgi:hypothetical protein